MEHGKSSPEGKNQSILVVDDDAEYLNYMAAALRSGGYQSTLADSAQAALNILSADRFALIITDLFMPGMSGFELLAAVRTIDPLMVGVIMTAFGSVDSAIDAVRQGAYDYLFKPSSVDAISLATRRALEHHSFQESLLRQARQLESLKLNCNMSLRLLQGVSHKLRNPLAAVRGSSSYLSDLLKDPSAEFRPDELKMSIELIDRNSRLMCSIIDELEGGS